MNTPKHVSIDVLKYTPIYVSLLDLDLNITWANEHASKEDHFSLYKKCYDGFNADMEQCTFCPVVRALASGQRESSFIEVFDASESADKVYEIIGLPLRDDAGQMIGVYEMRRDVSSHINVTDVPKTKKSKEETFSSEHLLDIVTYELNEHVDQALKMHQKMHVRKLNQEEKVGLAGIKTSLAKIQNVLNNITTMRNINKGMIKQNKKRIDLKKVVTDIVTLYENKADHNGNNFDYKYDSNIPTKLVFDQTKMAMVISNIVDYAMSHTANRSIYFITSMKETTDEHVLVSFKMDDIGSIAIHDEVKRDAGAYMKNNLTLAVIRHLVMSQHGELKIRPKSGYGINIEATFTLKKPFSKSKLPFFNRNNLQKVVKKDPSIIFESRKRKKILVAEDDPISRITIEQILNKDYDVILAKNGKVAVDKYFEESPDLVIMDIMMPVMNGFDAFDEIHHNCIKRVPIIACTSKVIRSEKEYLTSYGFDDYIAKPVNLSTLRSLIKKHI